MAAAARSIIFEEIEGVWHARADHPDGVAVGVGATPGEARRALEEEIKRRDQGLPDVATIIPTDSPDGEVPKT